MQYEYARVVQAATSRLNIFTHYKTSMWIFVGALPLFLLWLHGSCNILRSVLCSSEVAFDIRDFFECIDKTAHMTICIVWLGLVVGMVRGHSLRRDAQSDGALLRTFPSSVSLFSAEIFS